VNVRNRAHEVRATIEVPAGGAEGVIIAQGSVLGNWALSLLDGQPRWCHNLAGLRQRVIAAQAPVAADYVAPFPFTGGLSEVVVKVDGEPVIDAAAEARNAIVSQ